MSQDYSDSSIYVTFSTKHLENANEAPDLAFTNLACVSRDVLSRNFCTWGDMTLLLTTVMATSSNMRV